MPFPSPAEQQILERKLADLQNKTWLPPELLALVNFTATAQRQCLSACEPLAAGSLSLRDSAAHRQGAPLLDKTAFPLHKAQCAALFRHILEYMCEQQKGGLQAAAEQLYATLGLNDARADSEDTPLTACFAALLHEDEAYFDHWATVLPTAPRLMSFLAYNSLVPSLNRIAVCADACLDAKQGANQALWQHGHCPVCGSAPFMGYLGRRVSGKGEAEENEEKEQAEPLQDSNGQRFHVCSFCRHEYRVKRLQCPFCLEEDNSKLEYFSAVEHPGYQVHVCHSCKGYIKIADFREYTDRPCLPALDDLESLPLDIAAQQQGFSRLTLSPWGF